MQTFVNLPATIFDSVSRILSRSDIASLHANAKKLHDRYTHPDEEQKKPHIQKPVDALAYLSLRFPATFAQITSALMQIQDRVPHWKPTSVLDLGCGPGTGIWAATALWPDIKNAVGLDQDKNLLALAEEIRYGAGSEVTWIQSTVANWLHSQETYDLIIIANVLNELPKKIKDDFFSALQRRCTGIVVLLEPGTPRGFNIIQSAAEKMSPLIAPYIDDTFIRSDDYWIHFPQRFIRPDFQRRVRQSMRDSDRMASDWEETTFSYVAWGHIPVERTFWGQSIGDVQKYHGYLMFPVLTADGIIKARIMKRHKKEYGAAKNIRWGSLIEENMNE